MLLPNIVTGIEVCIEAIATVTTQEETLRTTVGTVLVPATATSLRGVSRVNLDHLDTSLLCLVYQEAMELRETPIMESTLCFRILLHRGAFTNVRQVLKDNGTAGGNVLNDTLRKYMVVISSLAKQFPRELTQVAFCALCAFALKFTTEAENTFLLFFPSPFA